MLARPEGVTIFVSGYPVTQQVNCATLAPVGSALSYDAETDGYVYPWQTDKRWANTCRLLTLRLVDDEASTALFRFSR